MKPLQILLYPIFLQCLQFTEDTFWQGIFHNLAYGKTPEGTYISNNMIICKQKNKNFQYRINPLDNPEEVYTILYNFYSNKLNILSSNELVKKKLEFENYTVNFNTTYPTWNSIRRKNIQDTLIENFVIEIRTKYNLSLKQMRSLHTLISIGRMLKVIQTKDIQYENGKILSINGIEFANKRIIFDKEMYNSSVEVSNTNEEKIYYLSDLWEKFIANIQKLIQS
jgi:hypothetical protein